MSETSPLVKRALRQHGLSREQLADRLGIHVQTLRSWEAGDQRPNPANREKLGQLAVGRAGPDRRRLRTGGRPRQETVDAAAVIAPSAEAGPFGTGKTTSSAATLSGWPCHPSERADFYHRVRSLPPEVARWRQWMIGHVSGCGTYFPAAAGGDESRVRALVDEGVVGLREVARLLAAVYGTPRLGNPEDPVDELLYIILSRRTREGACQATFERLKRRFPTWDALVRARRRTVTRLIGSGGLAEEKTRGLLGALRQLRERFGSCTLDPVRGWDDAQVEQFLCSLPGVDRKSAYCVMMYSLGRSVFPVDTHVGRILARLAPYRELGLDLKDLKKRKDHRRLQAVLADLVPPNLRYALHVNLIAHGREVCREKGPRCEQCEIRKFCEFYRGDRQAQCESSDLPTVVDLFSGAGGLSLGFGRAGFQLELALDSDADALRTLGLNHPELPGDRLLCEDIRELDIRTVQDRLRGRPPIDVVVGAPPCQGFSKAGFRSRATRTRGYRAMGEDRNYLFEWMLEIVLALRPRLVLLENVPGMNSARDEGMKRFMEVAREILEKGGYETDVWRLNASAFGVPQHRSRYFLVAAQGSEQFPAEPEAEYVDMHGTFDDEALPPICLDEAITDLPHREADDGEGAAAWRESGGAAVRNRRRYLAKFKILSESQVIYNHTVRYHNPRDLELYAFSSPVRIARTPLTPIDGMT